MNSEYRSIVNIVLYTNPPRVQKSWSWACVCARAHACQGTVHLLAPRRCPVAYDPDAAAAATAAASSFRSAGRARSRRAHEPDHRRRRAQRRRDRLGRRNPVRRLRQRLRRARRRRAGVLRLLCRSSQGRRAVVEEDGFDGHLRSRASARVCSHARARGMSGKGRVCACVHACITDARARVCASVRVRACVCGRVTPRVLVRLCLRVPYAEEFSIHHRGVTGL
jgi:hypothetical protein